MHDTYKQIKVKILKVPLLGSICLLCKAIVNLPQSNQKLYLSIKETNSTIKEASDSINSISTSQANQGERINYFEHRLIDLTHRLSVISNSPANAKKNDTTGLIADSHELDAFYIEFENRFRGKEKMIEERLKLYLKYFNELGLNNHTPPVLDIGCGRGELLKILTENNIRSVGLDLNYSMVEAAKKNGYEAIHDEALAYLSKQKSESFSAITGFHILEHIPFSNIIKLLEECSRVIKPGGFILFETPNPENFYVGSFSFYYDPSHLKPIPPEVLEFTASYYGFSRVEIIRSSPKNKEYLQLKMSKPLKEIVGSFNGPQDYAVIGYKA